MLARTRRHSGIALAVRAGVLAAVAAGAGCASSKPSLEPPEVAAVSVDTDAWIGKTDDWMLENYDGLLRSRQLLDGGEEWLYQEPKPRPDEPLLGFRTRNFFLPENPTHLVCFGPDKRVRTVILRGEPGWRTLPLPEHAD